MWILSVFEDIVNSIINYKTVKQPLKEMLDYRMIRGNISESYTVKKFCNVTP